MKKSISVSNLTFDMWLDYVRPALRAENMLEEVPARDDWHEFTAEVIDETTADEIDRCMTSACFNAHNWNNRYGSRAEAEQMLYQLDVCIEHAALRKVNAEDMKKLRTAIERILTAEDAETVTLAPADLPAEDCTWGDNDTADTAEKEEEKTMEKNIIETIRAELTAHNDRSAWNRGVTTYALELLDELAESIRCGYNSVDDIAAPRVLEKMLLNGAHDWHEYSFGGCSLIYDPDIAGRLCTPSEYNRTHGGHRQPNNREEWLGVQARALYQAAERIKDAARHVTKGE